MNEYIEDNNGIKCLKVFPIDKKMELESIKYHGTKLSILLS